MFKGKLLKTTVVLALMAVMNLVVGCNESGTPAGSVEVTDRDLQQTSAYSSSEPCQITTCSGRSYTVVASEAYVGSDIPQVAMLESSDNRTHMDEGREPSDQTSRRDWFNAGAWMNTALADEGVQSEMAGWVAQGRQFDWSQSMVIHGKAVPEETTDSIEVIVVLLAMEPVGQPDPFTVQIEYAYTP